MIPSPLMGEGQDEGENPRFDMPWQVATLYEDRALFIAPLHFIFFGRSLIYYAHSKSVIARSLTVFWLDDVAISSVKIFLSKRKKDEFHAPSQSEGSG